ncbi:MAG TPA: helix-turn-helix domain-containing protein [Candidatus Saccharimonas sp.]|nr:helix-turn-helix domain-containing protein [Candidatus Saccharimonas sp.]
MDPLQQLQSYLQKIDIDPMAAAFYIELTQTGPTSALQLAKQTGVSRTQVYRYLEILQTKGLVSAEQLSYGTLFRSLPLQNLDNAIAAKEAEVTALRTDLNAMASLLRNLAGSAAPQATVRHYYGLAGIKQANWNLTKAEGEFCVFETAHISEHLDPAFVKRFRERVIERNITSYDLTNATKVTADNIGPFAPSRTFYRRVDQKTLQIQFEMYLYNDVVTLLDYTAGAMQAVEIQHPSLHAMMRQLFDAMWRLGEPLEII